jgi:superfamily II DNA helicase RecQ
MQIRIFSIPITDNGEIQSEMNRFLATARVLEIEQYFYQNDKGACWSFCVRYLSSSGNATPMNLNKNKTDYKEMLTETEFAVFSKLRQCRKILAANEAVPAYAVFTDVELAGIAQLPAIKLEKLIAVKGIGDKKVEKYGKALLDLLSSLKAENEKRE